MPKQTKQPKSEQPKKKAPTKPQKPDEEGDAKVINEVKERSPMKKQRDDGTSSESSSEDTKPLGKKVKKEAPAPHVWPSLDLNSTNLLELAFKSAPAQPGIAGSTPGGRKAPITLDSDSDSSDHAAHSAEALYDSVHVWFALFMI